MSMYSASIPQMSKLLTGMSSWLDKAVAHATAKKLDPNVFASERLIADMYPLARQVQSAADAAKFAGARLSGKEAPKNPDTETTIDELKARIASTVAFLATVTEADFKDADKRIVPLSFMPGKGLKAADYLNEMAMPNFYFHLTTAYNILRRNGVDIGKMDFMVSMNLIDV